MRRFFFYCIVIIFFGCPPAAPAHTPVWDVTFLGSSQNLPTNYVRAILPDRKGGVYIGTWGEGVWRINPKSWAIQQLNNDFEYDSIRTLALDPQGRVWAGSSVGLTCHADGDPINFDHGNEDDNSISSLAVLADGSVWAGSTGRIFAYNALLERGDGLGASRRIVLDHDLSHGEAVKSIAQSRDGTVWAAFENRGVFRFLNGEWSSYNGVNGPLDDVIALRTDASGFVWIMTRSELIEVGRDGWRSIALPLAQPESFLVTREGSIFLGTRNGLWQEDHGEWVLFDPMGKLERPFVGSLHQSEDGSILAGTRQGLVHLYPTNWNRIDRICGERPFSLNALLVDPRYSPFAADECGSLMIYDDHNWRLAAERLFDFNPSHLALRGKTLWALGENEIAIVSLKTYEIEQRITLPESIEPFQLIANEPDPVLLFGIHSIHEITPEGGLGLRWSSSDVVVQRGMRAKDGTIWLGLEDGLMRSEGGAFVEQPSIHGDFVNEKVLSLMERRNGELWFGTSADGIFIHDRDDGSWRHFTSANGPRESRINQVFESSDGTIWTGLINGRVSNYKDDHWIHFSTGDGLPPWENRQIGETPDGDVWFLFEEDGQREIYQYQASDTFPETRIAASPEEYNATTYGLFSFIGNDVWHNTQQSQLVYSWQVESRDGQAVLPWSAFDTATTLRMPSLKPGAYRFSVRAMNRNRSIDPTPAVTTFTVLGPIWSRPAFYIPLLFFIVVIAILTVQNIKRRRMVTRMAYYDLLTGLPNRTMFLDRVELALAYMQRKGQIGAFLFIDLDGFKEVNDRFGHAAGDAVLVEFASRLRNAVRRSDTAARFGGDEFVVLLQDIESVAVLPMLIEKILSLFDQSFTYKGHALPLSASVGASVFPEHGSDAEVLLKTADSAMYEAKGSQRRRFVVSPV